MNRNDWPAIVEALSAAGVTFQPGLSGTEISTAERTFQFRFPPDLRAFLEMAMPCGGQFPDWRNGDESLLREWLNSPLDGILFDIEYNSFWLSEWGPLPKNLTDAKEIATRLVHAAPKLIPINGHRMIADEPHEPGNPIFSVHQTDIIYYGLDLDDYFRNEFHFADRNEWTESPRAIRFWDIDRFCDVRWSDGPCVFDNRDGQLP